MSNRFTAEANDIEITMANDEDLLSADEEVAHKRAAPRKTYVDPERRFAKTKTKSLSTALRAALKRLGEDIARQIKAKMSGFGKADTDHGGLDIDDILNGLHIDLNQDLSDVLENDLRDIYQDSGRLALSQLGSRVGSDLVDQVNDRALNWASEHAADLVGMGPDADYSISEAVRDMLRATITDGIEANLSAEQIGDSIEGAYAFSEERADLIAMTEIASANSMGALAGYEEAAADGLTVRKSWLILDDACDDCQANEADGVIELDAQFSSGDDAPPAHPNCRCVLVPEVEDAEGNVEELDEIEGE